MTHAPRDSEPELARLRVAMDAVNARLCAVLQERAQLCRRIAAHKRAHTLPLVDQAREADMLARMLASAGDGFAPDELATILRAVLAASRRIVTGG